MDEFKNSVLALVDIGKFFKLPVVLTSSFEAGPNGPLVPEVKAAYPDAPMIARPGQISMPLPTQVTVYHPVQL